MTLHATHPAPLRDPAPMLEQTRREWGAQGDLWIFGYASLIWRPDFEFAEQRLAHVHGWHRALKMWSRINRGTPECPGLVFALLSGGSCHGMVFRVPRRHGDEVLATLWQREMVTAVYDPRWLHCQTAEGPVRALAFTLSRSSPSFTGDLTEQQYRQIFCDACGKYGTTLDYARQTLNSLHGHGIDDATLRRLLQHAEPRDARAHVVLR
jgi:glutathione-specific gamma-glutamylcyclotransferase